MDVVTFIREGITSVPMAGETILEMMRREKLNPNAPCGGNGKCGKCTVRIKESENNNGTESWKKVLACRTKAVPGMQIDTLSAEEKARILTEGVSGKGEFNPALRQLTVQVPPCPAGQSISDWTRLVVAIRNELGAEAPKYLTPNPGIASQLCELCRNGKGKIFVVIYGCEVLAVSDHYLPCYMAAFDIGTTTVAGFLLHAEDGTEAAVASAMNPQSQFGADVINRANYTLEHGMKEVTDCIHECINALLLQMAEKAGITTEDIYLISIAGNTCMHHLFLGISVDSLVHAPYNPAIAQEMVLRCADYGIHASEDARIMMLPDIAGFVGADTVACLVATDLSEQKCWTLLIDIGTNGEMVLGKDHHMSACSTAAGPAFEGAGITFGMRGCEGAISKVEWNGSAWKTQIIGGGKARGICGSGLLDAAAQLLFSGQMDESGQMEDRDFIELADSEHSAGPEPVILTQKDIRELQLAKAAIASGIRLLCEKEGIRTDEIEQVWLAGAFGSFLSPVSACRIGMIPPVLRNRITAVGNAAGEGAKRVLREKNQWKRAAALAREAQFLELAGMPQFQDCFVDELMFPEEEEYEQG